MTGMLNYHQNISSVITFFVVELQEELRHRLDSPQRALITRPQQHLLILQRQAKALVALHKITAVAMQLSCRDQATTNYVHTIKLVREKGQLGLSAAKELVDSW